MGNMARQLVQIGLRVEKLTRCGRGGEGREGRGEVGGGGDSEMDGRGLMVCGPLG